MQVRVTPRKLKAAKEPTKKVIKSTKSRSEYPSTNVSSPVRPRPKQNMQLYMSGDNDGDDDKDDECYAEAPHPVGGANRRGNRNDGFTAPDDSGDDTGFRPIRIAKPLRQAKAKTPTAPITTDERVSNLTDFQKDVLNDFMEGAKNMVRTIKIKSGIRYAPFSDTVLREMCLDLPDNEEELLAIPGVNPEMVQRFGKIFLRLVKQSSKIFGDNAPAPKNMPKRHRLIDVEEEDDEEDQTPLDPNHQVVIDLCDSEVEQERDEMETESNYSGEDEDNDEENNEELHVSHHFNQQADPRVERFNSRFSQIEADRPNPRPNAPATTKSFPSRGAGSKTGSFKKKGGYRKKGSGGIGRAGSYSGVSKRGGGKAAGTSRKSGSLGGGRATASGANSSRRPVGGGVAAGAPTGGRGPILPMPT
jgi:bloom syndrome protein